MRVLLLAAGFGTRLRPLTDTIPKCLVQIKGRPLLIIWLERLVQIGMGPFLINTHYHATQVADLIASGPFCDQVTLAYEPILRGTAGTLIANLDFFQGEDGMLIHADNYCLADLNAFKQAHITRPSECLMTMMIFRTNSPTTCGIVELDARGVVVGFYEKVDHPPGNMANGAVYILSAELLKRLNTDLHAVTDFSTEVLSNLVGSIYTYETSEVFIDIGTIENYQKANQ
jgi:mannose-1-phosphate guanylyltransferase